MHRNLPTRLPERPTLGVLPFSSLLWHITGATTDPGHSGSWPLLSLHSPFVTLLTCRESAHGQLGRLLVLRPWPLFGQETGQDARDF